MSLESSKPSDFEFDVAELLEKSSAEEQDLPLESEIKDIYATSVLGRAADDHLINKRKLGPEQGGIGAIPPARGHEIAQASMVHAIETRDWLWPYYRDNVSQVGKISIDGAEDEFSMFGSLLSDKPDPSIYSATADLMKHYVGIGNFVDTGCESNSMHPSIVVGAHLQHAAGTARASNIAGNDDISVASFGDGATSEGEFHEALNIAGTENLPVVFYCQNNNWAISTPGYKQTGSDTIAQKANSYGFEGIKVNADNPITAYTAVKSAARKARKDREPTLIEAVTTRLGDHTFNDDDGRYRERPETDPLEVFERYMLENMISREDNQILKKRSEEIVRDSYIEAEEMREEVRKNPDLTEHTYEERTSDLEEQRKMMENQDFEPESWRK